MTAIRYIREKETVVSKLAFETAHTLVRLSALAVQGWLKSGWRRLVIPGAISYSVYLVHGPIGGRGKYFTDGGQDTKRPALGDEAYPV